VKLRLIWVGKNREMWVREAVADYEERIRRYAPLELIEVREEKGAQTPEMRRRECARIEKLIQPGAFAALLDEQGKQMDSPAFASFIGKQRDTGIGELTFIIGGSYGFSDDFKRGKNLVSLSKMTFTHQMVRVFLLEQIYRAFTILNNEPYHH